MLASGTTRFFSLIGGAVLPATLAALCLASPVHAQETTDSPVPTPSGDLTNPDTDPNNVPTVVPWTGLLSLDGGQRLLTEADAAIAAQNYPLAQQRFQQARQIFNQLSNYHQQISNSYSGIDLQIAQEQRSKALEGAELRDQATYQLALVHRAQNQPSLAVPLLVQVLRSQNPTRPLGEQAAGQLQELGLIVIGAATPDPDAPDSTAPDPENGGVTVSNPNSGLLSLPGGQRLLGDAEAAIARQDYAGAQERLQQARQVFNQLSNFHQQISASYAGIDNDITQDQRRKALESAQLRDRATYQLALVHRAQNQTELALPLLVQMVTSQGPTRDLGEQASQQLRELGFIGSSLTPRPVVGGNREAAANPANP